MLPAKFHVVSRLLRDFDAIVRVNLKSASFVIIMLLNEGLTHIQ